MTPLPLFRTTRPALVALVASALVALQFVTALHFALVPHGFSAGLCGFVHVHAQRPRAEQSRFDLERPRPPGSARELVSGSASCASESCPIGFAGHHSIFHGSSQASSLLALVVAPTLALPGPFVAGRSRVLLSAPKTSPPV